MSKLPNILTISRILMIPFLVFGIINLSVSPPKHPQLATAVFLVFLIACVTDFLDGYLARKWNVTSDFGRMIDPIADKLLVAGCLIAFAILNGGAFEILVPALFIIGRDILVSGAREHAALKNITMPPTQLAKWKTACEMLAIFLLLLMLMLGHYLPLKAPNASEQLMENIISGASYGGVITLWIAAILSVYTGSLYFRAALKSK
jgi:CDP-diacylglycerol--glycerol-3-phosphate 3-phosphatidyltransferase